MEAIPPPSDSVDWTPDITHISKPTILHDLEGNPLQPQWKKKLLYQGLKNQGIESDIMSRSPN